MKRTFLAVAAAALAVPTALGLFVPPEVTTPIAAPALVSSHPGSTTSPVGRAVGAAPTAIVGQKPAVHAVSGAPLIDRLSTATSTNWSGLVTSGSFQGIAGEWTVPSVQATSANRYSCTWVGLDGFTNSSLIQTGTEEDSVNGKPQYYAWLETIPNAQTPINSSNGSRAPVAAGDTMWAYIYKTGTTTWTVFLEDVTRGWTLTTSRSYSTPGANVDWIHEATQVGGVVGRPPVFSKVTFTSLEVEEAGTWYYTAMNSRSEVYLVQNGVTYATPSAPTATAPQSFSITYG